MFDEFWALYPRREAKLPAQKAFNKLNESDKQAAIASISLHIERWKALDTEKQFIPLAGTWINQRRFEDEIELPKPKVVVVDNWWGSESGVINKGQSLGLSPRPGESIHEFKGRVGDKLRSAA